MLSKHKLVVGCGNKTHRSKRSGVEDGGDDIACPLHRQSYDTMDRMNDSDCYSSDPTFKQDINDKERIQREFKKSDYEIIIFERVPFTYIGIKDNQRQWIESGLQEGGALSCSYLLNENGMLAFISCDFLLYQLDVICENLRQAGFKSMFYHNSGTCFFFKCGTDMAQLLYDKYLKSDSYLMGLVMHEQFLIPQSIFFGKYPVCSLDELSFPKEEKAHIEQKAIFNKNKRSQNLAVILPPSKIAKTILNKLTNRTHKLDPSKFKSELIKAIFNCDDSAVLKQLHLELLSSRDYDFLHKTNSYSRYETMREGKIIPVKHTWAQIERALSIQVSRCLLDSDKYILSQQKIHEEYPFIKHPKKRRLLFFRPSISKTYAILTSDMTKKDKLAQLDDKQKTLQKNTLR